MKKLIFAFFAFVFLSSAISMAQDTIQEDNTTPAAQQTQEHDTSMHTKSVTGCLKKGDEAGEFAITGSDGKTWEAHSKDVQLEQHVGHQVTVTGSADHKTKTEKKSEEKEEGQVEKASAKEVDQEELTVTDLRMVSETCVK